MCIRDSFNMYHGPAFAAIHNRTPASMRATATSIAIFFSAFVGLGLGPLLTGILSDAFATSAYAGPGSYAMSCTHAALAADRSPAALCTAASGAGLRYALVGAQTFSLLGALCFAIAGHQIGRTSREQGALPVTAEI